VIRARKSDSLYVHRPLLDSDAIRAWANEQWARRREQIMMLGLKMFERRGMLLALRTMHMSARATA
jgi:hypothetical protein